MHCYSHPIYFIPRPGGSKSKGENVTLGISGSSSCKEVKAIKDKVTVGNGRGVMV